MTVYTLDPYAPDAAERLQAWLRDRGEASDDLADDGVLPSILWRTERPLVDRVRAIPGILPTWRVSRRYRSNQTRIGLYTCDILAIDGRLFARDVTAARGASVGLAVLVCHLLGLSGSTAVMLAALVWISTGWRLRFAVPAGALLAVTVVVQHPTWVLWMWLVLNLLVATRALLAVYGSIVSNEALVSPVAFLGRGYLTRALWDRTAAAVILAIDKATHDDVARAEIFIDAAPDRIPPEIRAVLVQCRALAAAADLEFQSALRLSLEARELADNAPAAVRGWIALQSGDVCNAAGRPEVAQMWWQHAAELLHGVRRARRWAIEADLRRIEALTRDLSDTERCLDGLRLMCNVRTFAIRYGNSALLDRAERHLLHLMVQQADGVVGTVMHLQRKYDTSKGKVVHGLRAAEHADELILLTTNYLNVIADPELYPAADHVTGRELQARYAYLAGAMDNALRHLSRSNEPVWEARVYAALARLQRELGLRSAALGNVLESLNIVQRVRYQLPTSRWRDSWMNENAHVYAMALDLAWDTDPALLGELLETVRAQAVPLDTAPVPGGRFGPRLDALITGPAGSAADADGPSPSIHLLQTDSTILVQQASWVGGTVDSAIDIDQELDAMFPGGWYWSSARVEKWVYHAVRSPSGEWTAYRRSYEEISGSFTDLACNLPVHVAGKEPPDDRLAGTVFAVESGDIPVAGLSEPASVVAQRLFDELGAALLPDILTTVLTATDAPTPLVLAPTGSLLLVPFAALSVTPARSVIDCARITYLPSIALLAQRRRQAVAGTSPTPLPQGDAGHVLAVLAPDFAPEHQDQDLDNVLETRPPGAEIVTGPLRRPELAAHLRRMPANWSVLYLGGHVVNPPNDPATMGFRLAPSKPELTDFDYLGLRDFYETGPDGRALFPLPGRVSLSGCASIGHYEVAPATRVDSPEWLALAAAIIYGGASHVYCTLFRVPDCEHSTYMDLELVAAMRTSPDPADALREVVRAEMARWRRGDATLPLVYLAYVYVGIGPAPDRPRLPIARPSTAKAVEVASSTPVAGEQEQTLDAIRPKPKTYVAPFGMMAWHGHDEAGLNDSRSPNVVVGGHVEFGAFDGVVSTAIPVRHVMWTKQTDIFGGKDVEWTLRKVDLYLTDCRLVLVAQDRQPDRTLTGHIRYPWISSIGWRPRQGLLYDCELVLTMQQETDPDTALWYELTLTFEAGFDSGGLAHRLAHLVGHHHLAHGSLPPEAIPGFQSLSTAALLDSPKRGEYATYYPVAFSEYPHGVEYVRGDPPRNMWRGPAISLDEPEPDDVTATATPEQPAPDAPTGDAERVARSMLDIAEQLVEQSRSDEAASFDLEAVAILRRWCTGESGTLAPEFAFVLRRIGQRLAVEHRYLDAATYLHEAVALGRTHVGESGDPAAASDPAEAFDLTEALFELGICRARLGRADAITVLAESTRLWRVQTMTSTRPLPRTGGHPDFPALPPGVRESREAPQVPPLIVIGDIPAAPLEPRDFPEALSDETFHSNPGTVHVLTGPTGCGKTTVAAAIARSRAGLTRGLVGWIDATTADQVLAGLACVADAMGCADDDGDSVASIERLQRLLDTWTDPAVLVFDDLSDPAVLRRWLWPSKTVTVIVTSSNTACEALGTPFPVTGGTGDVTRSTIASILDDPVDSLVAPLVGATAVLAPNAVPLELIGRLATQRTTAEQFAAAVEQCHRADVVTPSVDGSSVTMRRFEAQALTREPPNESGLSFVRERVLAELTAHDQQAPVIGDSRLIGLLGALWASAIAADEEPALLEQILRARSAVVDRLRHEGERRRVLDLADELLADADRVFGDEHPVTLDSRHLLGRTQQGAGVIDEAIATYRALVHDRERVFGADDVAVLDVRSDLVDALTDAQQFEDAVTEHEVVLAARERIHGTDHPDTVEDRILLAAAYRLAGRMDEATTVQEALVETRTHDCGPLHPETVELRCNLIKLRWETGSRSAAVAEYESLLLELESASAPGELVSHVRRRLLDTYRKSGRDEAAVPLLIAEIRYQSDDGSPNHPTALSLRDDLADAYSRLGQYDDAILVYEELQRYREQSLGPEDPSVFKARLLVARNHHLAERLAESIALFEDAVSDCLRRHGPHHEWTLTLSHNLAYTYARAGRHDDAIQLYETTVRDRIRVLGPDANVTLISQSNLATEYREAGRYDDAIATFRTTLRSRIRAHGADDRRTLDTRDELAGTLKDAGQLDEAISHYRVILGAVEKSANSDWSRSAAVHYTLGRAYLDADRFSDAVREFTAARDIRTRQLGPDDEYTLFAAGMLALSLRRSRRFTEAIPVYEDVLARRERLFGPDESLTVTTRTSLAHVLVGAGRVGDGIELWERLVRDHQRDDDGERATRGRMELAAAYCLAERYDSAIDEYRVAIRDRERTVGPDHVDTAAAVIALAEVLRRAQRPGEVVTLLDPLVDRYVSVLGENHRLTRKAHEELAEAKHSSRSARRWLGKRASS